LSNPQALLFDTSILLAHINRNKTENEIAAKALAYADQFPHAARLTVSACMVELFDHTRKFMDPKDVLLNLNLLNIKLCSISDSMEQDVLELYCKFTFKNEYDFADFSLCTIGLMFNPVTVLTMDRDDMALAMARAFSVGTNKSTFHVEPFS
jgi:predicted nucleic acid-binding protein